MTNSQGTETDLAELEAQAAKGVPNAKKELAEKLLAGGNQNDVRAVSLLEECAAGGDDEAMLMLAKNCVLGRGMEQNVERAKELISESEKRGNSKAGGLRRTHDYWNGKKAFKLRCSYSICDGAYERMELSSD